MKIKKFFTWFFSSAILFSSLGTFSAGAQLTGMSPFLEKGAQAVLSDIATPDYSLYTCQVVGLNPGVTCYDPYQIRTAYGIDTLINAGFDGRGKTIVIVDAYQSPNIATELNTFDSFYGLPGLNGLGNPDDPSLGTFTQVAPDGLTPFNSSDDNMIGWAEEITLDVEWAHAIAPGANITLVLSSSNDDAAILSATQYAVDNRLGDVISQSFGEDERCMDQSALDQQHQIFVEATQKDITLFASSGDQGAAQPTCDNSSFSLAASTPASDPLVTGVGGTELQAARYCLPSLGCDPSANPAPGTRLDEVVWNEFGSEGSGGGYSVLFSEPYYQKGVVSGKQRGLPDISYSAAVYHGVLVYINIPGDPTGWYLFGGTSAGSPQWAAILAITDQKAGRSLGFINRGLYQIGKSGKYGTGLNDVTVGNNSVVEDVPVDGYEAGPGWDAASGLGSPKAEHLVNYLIQIVTPNDGLNAINDTKMDANGNTSGPNQMKSH